MNEKYYCCVCNKYTDHPSYNHMSEINMPELKVGTHLISKSGQYLVSWISSIKNAYDGKSNVFHTLYEIQNKDNYPQLMEKDQIIDRFYIVID